MQNRETGFCFRVSEGCQEVEGLGIPGGSLGSLSMQNWDSSFFVEVQPEVAGPAVGGALLEIVP
jgi:hypothetical protein